jgi:hypothetical protein
MAIPPLTRQLADHLLESFCAKCCPSDLREQVRVSHTFRGDVATIHEHRVAWDDPRSWTMTKVAAIRYDPADGTWQLFCFDRNARRRAYRARPTADIAVLLAEIDDDPTGIFWG